MTDTNLSLPSTTSSIEELLSRDPLSLSEEDLEKTTRLLIQMNREQIRVWNEEKERAEKEGRSISGQAVKKKQLSAARQVALSNVPDFKI